MARHVNGASVRSESLSLPPKDDTTSVMVQVQAEDADRIRIKNRRKRYLDLHPEYTHGSNLELAGRQPLITPISLSHASHSSPTFHPYRSTTL